MIPAPLFDTQVAAPLLGLDDQMGYARLIDALLDIDLPKALFEHYGHTRCGLYLSVEQGGRIAVGDPVLLDGTGATA